MSHDHANGMDMSMDGAMPLAVGQMLTFLHFTPGDTLWFQGWVPASSGAMVGACIGLFFLAVVDRWMGACRAVMEVHWRTSAQIAYANRINARRSNERSSTADPERASITSLKHTQSPSQPPSDKPSRPTSAPRAVLSGMRNAPPFIAAHDVMRGVLYAGQAALGFAFMLAVMTYQLGFILAIVIGLGVGETLFGRYSGAAHAHVM